MSREQLTAEQLQSALAAQRSAGRGRIGEWLQTLGFVTEQQVTAALARQWACPVLRTTSVLPQGRLVPQLPVSLLEQFVMIPISYIASTATLHMAFSEGIDYSVLYSIEQMLGCHTEACLAAPSLVRSQLAALSTGRGENEIAFERVPDNIEISRIVRSYCIRLGASEVRLVRCGDHIWFRLLRPSHPAFDLVQRSCQIRASEFPPVAAAL